MRREEKRRKSDIQGGKGSFYGYPLKTEINKKKKPNIHNIKISCPPKKNKDEGKQKKQDIKEEDNEEEIEVEKIGDEKVEKNGKNKEKIIHEDDKEKKQKKTDEEKTENKEEEKNQKKEKLEEQEKEKSEVQEKEKEKSEEQKKEKLLGQEKDKKDNKVQQNIENKIEVKQEKKDEKKDSNTIEEKELNKKKVFDLKNEGNIVKNEEEFNMSQENKTAIIDLDIKKKNTEKYEGKIEEKTKDYKNKEENEKTKNLFAKGNEQNHEEIINRELNASNIQFENKLNDGKIKKESNIIEDKSIIYDSENLSFKDYENNNITSNNIEMKKENDLNKDKENKDAINKSINSTESEKVSKLENNIEASKISVNFTKEEVCNFLKIKLKLEQKVLDKMEENEIDGDALILLINNDYKFSDLKIVIRKKILKYLETDIMILQNNIKDNELYKEIYTEEIDKLWEENKFNKLKLGDKLKYIKYLIIRDPPPEIEKKKELDNYLNKIIKNENINEIQEVFQDLLNFNEKDFYTQFEEWDLDNDDIFKLKFIIKIIKQNQNKSQQKEENNNDKNKNKPINIINPEANLNKINEVNRKKDEIIYLNNNKNIHPAPDSLNSIRFLMNEKKYNNYSFYCVVEVYIYDTSQREKTLGLRNPIEEFKKLCNDLNIKFENNCSFIDYNDAEKIELSTYMLWGSKNGLKAFLKENNIEKLFIEYMTKNDYLEKAGIYLCFNAERNLGYLIIWPGKFSYYYSKITEPNDNILLTLVCMVFIFPLILYYVLLKKN